MFFWIFCLIRCNPFSLLDAVDRNHQMLNLDSGTPVLFLESDSKYSKFSLAVNTGGLDDLKSYPGTSHLLEHVVFGVKSPLVKFIYDHGGSIIACTEERCMFFEFMILNEYFEETLNQAFITFNNPELDSSTILREIDLIEDEFNYRTSQKSKIVNIYTEVDDLDVFMCGNRASLSRKGIEEGLDKVHKDNFLSYNGSIVCVTNNDIKIIKDLDLVYKSGSKTREVDFGLTDYYCCTERLFLVNSKLNHLRLSIQIPLQDNAILISYLMERYSQELKRSELFQEINFLISSEFKYTVIKMSIGSIQNVPMHTEDLIKRFIDIVKSTQISIQEYEETTLRNINFVRNRRPCDDDEYTNVHKYLLFKKYLFEERKNAEEISRFKAFEFANIIKNLIIKENYSLIYECPLVGQVKRSRYSKIEYVNQSKKSDLDSKENRQMASGNSTSKRRRAYNRLETCSIQRNSGNERGTDNICRVSPLDLLIFERNEFLETPKVFSFGSYEDYDYSYETSKYKATIVHLEKEKNRRVAIFQFIVEPNYKNFKKLIFITESIKNSLCHYYSRQSDSQLDFNLKYNMLEITWTSKGYICDRKYKIFCETLLRLIKESKEDKTWISLRINSIITSKLSVIAEMVYGYPNLMRDFGFFLMEMNAEDSLEMPAFYLNVAIVGDVGKKNILLAKQIGIILRPSLTHSQTLYKEDTFYNVTRFSTGYNTASLYIRDCPEATKTDYIVRLACYFALYRLSEILRVKDKIGYYIVTDFTSRTYYKNFLIEAYSKKTVQHIFYILHAYIEDVVKSLEDMDETQFKKFTDVVYSIYKIRKHSCNELLRFYRGLDFKFNHLTFNDELLETLNSPGLKHMIIHMLKKKCRTIVR